jgi:hypothetical protein
MPNQSELISLAANTLYIKIYLNKLDSKGSRLWTERKIKNV